MSQIVGGIAASHTPLLTVPAGDWPTLAARDRANPDLYDRHGNPVTYDELVDAAGARFAAAVTSEHFEQCSTACEAGLDALAAHVARLRPDAVVIVGDDQLELFDATNQPAIAVYSGDVAEVALLELALGGLTDTIRTAYAMEGGVKLPVHQPLARWLASSLVSQEFDVSTSDAVPPGKGFGHAFGFISRRLTGDDTPIVPIALNTYYPPNQPTARRSYNLGVAIRRAIEGYEPDLRVMVAASGGLSHFVVDEEIDRRVLDAIEADDAETLCSIPARVMQAGSSEIRNWIAVAGTMSGRPVSHRTYVSCVRTEAGTGIGAAFLAWE